MLGERWMGGENYENRRNKAYDLLPSVALMFNIGQAIGAGNEDLQKLCIAQSPERMWEVQTSARSQLAFPEGKK